jgi:hypothetical protein
LLTISVLPENLVKRLSNAVEQLFEDFDDRMSTFPLFDSE